MFVYSACVYGDPLCARQHSGLGDPAGNKTDRIPAWVGCESNKGDKGHVSQQVCVSGGEDAVEKEPGRGVRSANVIPRD